MSSLALDPAANASRDRRARYAGYDMATQQERNEARRKEKLAQIQEQVEDGSLVIRKMTPKERAANPPRPRPAKRGKRK
jgi:hypothetical protein